jgi:hypothetical protein
MRRATALACFLLISCARDLPRGSGTTSPWGPTPSVCIAEPGESVFQGPSTRLENLDETSRTWALDVARLIFARSEPLRACYGRRLAETPGIRGESLLTMAVSPDGKVSRAAASVPHPNERLLEHCLAGVACTWTFPPPPSGRLQVVDQPLIVRQEAP